MFHDNLGDRMKGYEAVPKTKLVSRMPVILRIDGKAFHTFTRGFRKPFDENLQWAMQKTMEYLCKNIQNCVFGYTQSDEITLVLVDYKKLNTSAFFNNEVQKICSIGASMATMAFNMFFAQRLFELESDITQETLGYNKAYRKALQKGAMFDCRCFNVPKEEVANIIYWRQLDAIRNSVQMVGQANFSHKSLEGKTCNAIKEMLKENGLDWENYPIYCQRGVACYKEENNWVTDFEMPILKEDWNYINQYVYVGD